MNFKAIIFASLFAVSAGSCPALAQGDIISSLTDSDVNVDLTVGEQQVIPAKGVKRYSEGSDIVDLRLDKDGEEFVMVGKRPGRTQILFLMKDGRKIRYNIRVRADSVRQRDNIRLDFYFLQISTTNQLNLGVVWPSTVGNGNINATSDLVEGTSSFAASVTSNVIPRIDLAQIMGWGKVKRRATVVAANGEQGMFNSGEEVFFRVINSQSSNIDSVEYGSTITVTPNFDKKTGRLDIAILADVSEQGQVGGEGIPNKVYSKIETKVNLRLGESVLLAGLEAQSTSKSTGGLPGLSQIPILGYLFGARVTSSRKTENLVFIVPTILEAVDYNDQASIKDAFRILKQFDGDWGRSLYELAEKPIE